MPQREQLWSQSIAPLGVPTLIITNDPELLATVRAAYADGLAEAPAAEPAIEIRLELQNLPSTGVSCEIKVEGSRLHLFGDGIAGSADAASGRARSTVPVRFVGDPAALAEEISDPLLLFILARTGRTPIHAAGVFVTDRLLLLAGPSGSGKSSLAMAAARRGLGVLSDDTIYVERQPRMQFWALHRPIHLHPDDAPAGEFSTRTRGGRSKVAIPIAVATARSCEAHLILVRRGETLGLEEIDGQDAIDSFGQLDPGFHLLRDEILAVARDLSRAGAWRLTLARDPAAAIDLLRQHFSRDTAE